MRKCEHLGAGCKGLSSSCFPPVCVNIWLKRKKKKREENKTNKKKREKGIGGGRAPEIRRGAGPTLLVFKQKGELLARSCLKPKTVQGEKSLPCTRGAFPAPGAWGGLQQGRGGHPAATAPVPGCWGAGGRKGQSLASVFTPVLWPHRC